MVDGSCIAFCELPQDKSQPSGRDPETPDWVQHFAFRVADKETLLKAKADLEAEGVDVIGPTNHDDFLLLTHPGIASNSARISQRLNRTRILRKKR
jgi:glyoxylase I family protein